MRTPSLICCLLAGLGATSASLAQQVETRPAQQAASDMPVLIGQDPVEYWIEDRKVAPIFPEDALRRGISGCVTIGFIIDSEGRTSTFRTLASTDEVLEQASVAAASRFRYFAAESNAARTPVFTSNTFTFRNSDASQSREEIKAVCDEKTRQLVQSMGQQ